MTRASIVLTGLIGLIGAVILTAFCVLVMAQAWIPALLTSPLIVWVLFLFLAVFSVAEIPIMIFGIRRIAASANPRAKYVALLTNTGYNFFAAVYAAPFILLTGNLWAGAALAALSLARFVSALIFLPSVENKI
ncbi:MAG: hypothetical protein JW953_01275 [Anaerolineae bacterium]|nr:hypothetical protein [Anaerolineae bacterium]